MTQSNPSFLYLFALKKLINKMKTLRPLHCTCVTTFNFLNSVRPQRTRARTQLDPLTFCETKYDPEQATFTCLLCVVPPSPETVDSQSRNDFIHSVLFKLGQYGEI